MVVLGLRCSSLVVASGGYFLVAMCWLLIAVASLLAEHGLQGTWTSAAARGLSSCGFQAPDHRLNSCGSCG